MGAGHSARKSMIDSKETFRTRSRYQWISGSYDLMEILPEKRYHPWREKLWSMVNGPRILEVGVGTGKNLASDDIFKLTVAHPGEED